MENLSTDAYRPDWQVWTVFGAAKAAALVTDGLRATRPVEFAVGRPAEAEAMFDVLTYQKGGAVLRMLEQYLGPEVFRKGISSYLTSHSFSNTETTDLWDALEGISGEPVGAIMDSWIHQRGYPLVTVSAGDDSSTLTLSQRRFSYGDGDQPGAWSVPITIRASVGGAIQRHRVLLDVEQATFSFDGPVEWVVVNDGAWGFYRVRYSAGLRDRLLSPPALDTLSSLERLGLVGDSWAQVVAGMARVSDWFATVLSVDHGEDPDVWAAVVSVLNTLDRLAEADDRMALRDFAHRIADPAWVSLGWDPAPGESRRATARARVLAVLGLVAEDEAAIAESSRRFAKFVGGDGDLAPDLVGVAARIVVASGGEDEWSRVLTLYRGSANPQERMRYLDALADTRDPGLQRRTLDLCLGDEVRTQDAPFVIAAVLAQRGAAARAWAWIEDNWAGLQTRFPPSLLNRLLEGITAITDAGLAADVAQFCTEREIPMAGPRLDQLLERMDLNVALAGRLRGSLPGTENF